MRLGRAKGLSGVGLVAVIVAGGCAASEGETTDRAKPNSVQQAIQGGQLDATHTFAVGICLGQNCQGICSGTLILPNLVVTARHCVDQSPQIIDCSQNPTFGARKVTQATITTGSDMFAASNAGRHTVKSITVNQDNHVCGNDIALLVLNDLVPAAEATPAIPGVQYPMTDPKYANSVTAIGYGVTSPNGSGSGTRRSRSPISILCVPGDEARPCPDFINAKDFVSGDGTCEGDSGSGAFDTKSFSTSVSPAPVSHGVLSRGGVSDDGTTCKTAVYTRLDAQRDFIVDTADAVSNNWALYPKPVPDWTVYVPPPPPVVDAGPPPTTVPSGKGLGETCAKEADCASKICADGAAGKICSKTCETGSSCPQDYTCQEGLCLPGQEEVPAPPPPPVTRTTTKSCSAAPGRDSAPGAPGTGAWLAAAVALAFAHRRRSERR